MARSHGRVVPPQRTVLLRLKKQDIVAQLPGRLRTRISLPATPVVKKARCIATPRGWSRAFGRVVGRLIVRREALHKILGQLSPTRV